MEQKPPGIMLPIVVAFVGLVVVVGAIVYYGSQKIESQGFDLSLPINLTDLLGSPAASSTPLPQSETPAPDETIVASTTPAEIINPSKGAVLGFTPELYEAAKLSGKLVLLYFSAPWCSECDHEEVELPEVAGEWSSDKVLVLRVSYAAETTSPAEKDLALEFGVIAPGTKVLLQAGRLVKVSSEMWNLDRYRAEIAEALP